MMKHDGLNHFSVDGYMLTTTNLLFESLFTWKINVAKQVMVVSKNLYRRVHQESSQRIQYTTGTANIA